MPGTIQEFLAAAAVRNADDLADAYLRLPEEKRNWKPAETSRSALNQVAEVAILNGYTAYTIREHKFGDSHMTDYPADLAKAEAMSWEDLYAMLRENSAKVADAIRAIPDDALSTKVAMPWGPMTLEQIAAYPHWNATYHEGQINYIASILGCL